MSEKKLSEDAKGEYVAFGDVARERCGMQCQYASRFLREGELGHDLRWAGDTSDYHFLIIHRDDADVFVNRLRTFRIEGGMGWTGEVSGASGRS